MPADHKKFNKTLLAHGKVDPVVYLNLNGLNCLDRSLVMRSKQNTSVKRAAQTAPVIALRFLGLLGPSSQRGYGLLGPKYSPWGICGASRPVFGGNGPSNRVFGV